MAEVSITKKSTKTAGKRVKEIHIRRVGNAIQVHHEREPEMKRIPGGGQMPVHGPSPEPTSFVGPKALKQMRAHVGDLSDQMGMGVGAGTGDGGGEGGDVPGAERPAPVT